MNRKILRFFYVLSIFILTFFYINNVSAYNVSSDNNPGNEYNGSSGSATGDTKWSTPYLNAIRIRVFRGTTVIKQGYYSLVGNKNDCYTKTPSVQHCETSSYNYSNVTSTSGVSCSSATISLGCIASTNLDNTWDVDVSKGEYLDNYFKNSNYTNLKSVLAGMGYNDTNFSNNDVVIVEPATLVNCAGNYYFGTSTAMMKKNVSYRGPSGNVCSASDEFGGWAFSNLFISMSKALKDTSNACSKNSYSGCGYFKYNISGLYQVPKGNLTITKKDSVTGKEISGAGFRIHSGSGCTGTIVKNGLSTNSSGKITVDDLDKGSYSIYEVLVPSGYATPTNRCTNVTITEGSTTPVTIYNDPRGDLVITKKDSATGKVISGAGFRIHSGSGCTGSIVKSEQKTNSNGVISVTGLTAGSYSIYESTIPSGYQTPSNRCTNVTVTGGVSTSVEIKNDPFPSLIITKTDNLGNPITGSKAKFAIYGNKLCQGSAMYTFESGDEISFNTSGIYYLKETKAPNGYHTPEAGDSYYCTAVHIDPGKNQLKIKNKSVCETEFESSSIYSDPNNINYAVYRVNLYNKLLSEENQDFRMLLDFSKTKAEEACQALEPKYTSNTSCLTTTQNNAIFNEGNVSMYTERVGSFNRTFCLTTYVLDSNLGSTSGFGVIKSGQLIKSNSDILATGTLKRVCYSYDTTGGSFESGFKYNNYVTSIPTLDGKELETEREVSSGGNRVTCSECNFAKQKYEKTISVNYKLPLLYASNMDGRIYTYCPSDKYCKVLGRGIETVFNLSPTVKINSDGSINRLSSSHKMNFVIQIEGKDDTATCEYDITNELITADDKLQLEFRTVTTNSSTDFLDKQGNIRNYGSNWSSEQDRKDVLDNSNNSYNKKNEDPLYTIELTPSIMSEIRQYNKNTSYSDFNFVCKNDGEFCISNYLTELRDSYGLEIYSTNTKRLCVEQNICP